MKVLGHSSLGHLSLEQEQELCRANEIVAQFTLEQAQSCIAEIMRQVIVRDNLIEHLLEATQIPQRQYSQSILFQSHRFSRCDHIRFDHL